MDTTEHAHAHMHACWIKTNKTVTIKTKSLPFVWKQKKITNSLKNFEKRKQSWRNKAF